MGRGGREEAEDARGRQDGSLSQRSRPFCTAGMLPCASKCRRGCPPLQAVMVSSAMPTGTETAVPCISRLRFGICRVSKRALQR